jgi:hypothetical protein
VLQAASIVDSEDALAECEPLPRIDLPTDHLAGVFRNFSAYKKGREALLTMQGSLFLKMCGSLRKGSESRRIAIAECIRNVALDPSTSSKPILPDIIAALALPFAPGCELREGDDTGMPLHLLQVPSPNSIPQLQTPNVLQVAAEPSDRREQCTPIRLACIESLRFIASTASGRAKIVACKVYPCLRDAHLVEQDDTVRELIEEVVELTQLDNM